MINRAREDPASPGEQAALQAAQAGAYTDGTAMVREYATPEQIETDRAELTRTLEDLLHLQRQVTGQQHTSPESWFAEGDLVIELDRLLRELADTSHTIRQTRTPPR